MVIGIPGYTSCIQGIPGLTLSHRSQLGPELQIVVLDMALEQQMDRIRERNKGEESAVELCKVGITNY